MKLHPYYSDPANEKTDQIETSDEESRFRAFLAQRAAARRAKKQKRPRAKTTELYEVLRELISPLNYGTRRPNQNRVHPARTNPQIVSQIRQFKAHEKKIPNYLLVEHFNRTLTVYFLGNNRGTLTLCGIDIDCLKNLGLGSPQGCRQFAEWLRRRFPGRLWIEVSPGGHGIHCYFILDKGAENGVLRRKAVEINAVLKNFQTWLRFQAREFDIEQVEIKGTLPVLEYASGQVVDVTSGQYCSLPRTATAGDLLKLKHIHFDELAELRLTKEGRRAIPKRVSASTNSFPTQDEVRAMTMLGKKWVQEFGEVRLATRHVVSSESWKGYLLLLLIHKRAKLKKDCFSTEWASATWNTLEEAGILNQRWHPGRWKFCRDWWSAYGQIKWRAANYWFGDEQGDGQACVWDASDNCIDRMKEIVVLLQGGDTFLHNKFTDLIKLGSEPFQRPKRVSPPASYILETALKRLQTLARSA